MGVLLAELLTQARPFDGETVLETMDNIKNSRVPEFPSLPTALSALLQLCLAPNKADRFASAGALFHALQQVSGNASMMSLAQWMSQV